MRVQRAGLYQLAGSGDILSKFAQRLMCDVRILLLSLVYDQQRHHCGNN